MLAAKETTTPVFSLAAPLSGGFVSSYLSENSRQGYGPLGATLHQALTFSKPLLAPGLPTCLYDSGRRSRCTGKERDAETGLDYFGARYFSSAQGRFTSPDWSTTPQPVPYANLNDPQTLNLYSYVRNNPLSNVDADGHCGIWGDPNCTWGQFFQSIPQRAIGGLKAEANIVLDNTRLGQVINGRFTPSNAEQADAMANRSVVEGPFMTGLAMAIPGPIGEAGEVLPDETVVVRGGTNTPEALAKGTGVTIDASGNLQGVSVQAAPGKTAAELSQGLPHNKVGVTTVGKVRDAGGEVTPDGTPGNPNHCTLCGVTPQKGSELLKVIPSPAKQPKEQQ
jgi:RHS repeat-associated protein